MPIMLLRALAAEIPRLEAIESLRRATEIALGTGSIKQDDQRRILSEWDDAANGGGSSRAPRQSPAQVIAGLEAMGVEVVLHPATDPIESANPSEIVRDG